MEFITNIFDVINDLGASLPDWLVAVTAVIASASGLVALTPTKKDDKVLSTILAVLNFLALNIGNAKK